MKKQLKTLLVTGLLGAGLFTADYVSAQSIDDAKKNLYYGKNATAKQMLTSMVNANPKNAEAIYWLGQANLSMDDVAGAKQVYQSALNSGMNDPLILVGMGHVALLEGNKNDARQRFEVAISTSMNKKKENPVILNAIGRANADGPTTSGDPLYAIDKLKRAAELDQTNADIYTNLGINYLKLGTDQGGNAYDAFMNAIRVDPNNAKAKFRLGRIFKSQGNTEKFLEYYNGAVTGDPAYAPGYLELYDYYSLRDVNKAKDFLDKYIANTDKNCTTDFFYADYLFRSGKYTESLTKAKAMENSGCSNFPRLKVLYAFDYDRLGDSAQARSNIESYLATADPAKIQPADYDLAGKILLKFPGQEATAGSYLEKALMNDTVPSSRLKYITSVAESLGKSGNYVEQLKWYRKLAQAKPELTARELYFYSDAAIKAMDFATADTVNRMYIQKFPDQPQGYQALAKAAIAMDKDTTTGTAAPAVMQYIKFLEKIDPVKYKNTIIGNYGYLAGIHANVNKDYSAALKDLDAILALDPENDYAKQAKAQIKNVTNSSKQPVKKKG